MSYMPAYDSKTWKVEDPVLEPLEVTIAGMNRNICEDEHFEDKVILKATYDV